MSFNKPFKHMLPTTVASTSSSTPWNSNDMFWTVNNTNNMVMEFNAIKNDPTNSNYDIMRRGKRKPEPPPVSRTPKVLLTEEFMAHHLNSMHISKDFTSHSSDDKLNCNDSQSSDILMVSTDQQHTVDKDLFNDEIVDTDNNNTAYAYVSQEELQQKLKNAQRISICEEVHKMKNEILPAALVERIERPCTALVLWKPLSNLGHFIQNNNNNNKDKTNDKEDNDIMESIENIQQQQPNMNYFEINKFIDDLTINLESGMDLD